MGTAGHFNRHHAYRWLSRVLFPKRYVSKMFLLTFVATHIPLLVLFVYTVFLSEFDTGITIDLLLGRLIATLVGTAVAMAGIWILLTPVASSSEALERYRGTGVRIPLPLDIRDEGGRLLANVHGTLEGLIRPSFNSKCWPPMTSSRMCTIGEREPGACSGTSPSVTETRPR